jgi:hypothetical protein
MLGSKNVTKIPIVNKMAPIRIIFRLNVGFLSRILPIMKENIAAIPYGINKK